MRGDVIFSGVFELREGVSEAEFLPTLKTFFEHFIDRGFASEYLIVRREVLDGFGKTLPGFTYRGALIYRDLERERAAYEYVMQNEEPVRSLHHAMNSKNKTQRGLLCRDLYRSVLIKTAHVKLPSASPMRVIS